MADRIQLALPARRDAERYAAFIRDERRSPAAARRWLAGLTDAPHRFAVIPEADELGCPCSSVGYHPDRIIYVVHDAEQHVVHRIYHGARRPLTGEELGGPPGS